MALNKLSIDSLDLSGKRVLIRSVDLLVKCILFSEFVNLVGGEGRSNLIIVKVTQV